MIASAARTHLGLPDSQSRPSNSRKHMPTPRDFNCANLARNIILSKAFIPGPVLRFTFLYNKLFIRYLALRSVFGICNRTLRVIVALRPRLGAIVRGMGGLSSSIFGGREHGGGGDGPIRHGALSQWEAAFGRAHLTAVEICRRAKAAGESVPVTRSGGDLWSGLGALQGCFVARR